MERTMKDIAFLELGVSARSKQDIGIGESRKDRITLIVTDDDTVYTVHMTRSNARYLIEKLSLAVKMAK